MDEEQQSTLLESVAQALRAHGLLLSVQDASAADGQRPSPALLRVCRDGADLDYAAVVKRRLSSTSIGAVLASLRQPLDIGEPPPLLLTDYVASPLAAQLRERRQQFADAAGNTYLEGRGLFVYVSGRKLQPRQLARRASRGFTATRLKVLFALICDPDLAGAPYRTIAAAANVALGAMPAVIADLQQHGSLIVSAKSRSLFARKRVLDEWAQAYALGLRGKALIGRFLAPRFDDWPDWQLNPANARWGGETAAALLLVDQLTPTALTIYGDKLPARLIAEQQLETASPAAYQHLLELRKPFWGASLQDGGRPDTVAPALVYADLLATGSARCIEAAEMLYIAQLAARFPPD
ncbi:type IV toxin-antitoxin system AbiEi family antitoxin [Candidatus Accumulibacter sp. ACC003]|uniref:type IV toxin-antitoxin system AbiEi family antitoxin n=1 Tax=Candidatus Accumulibacter sp. ACC003 TaxID=2823334 RepID=UPI0025C34EBB|nr:type IV toxin-antitoxin system AbiEi family antitoxin [Candidatus Accumulibacter sp. ACC003]